MAVMTTLIIAAITTAVLTTGAITYNATDGFGAGNKTKSSLDIQRERELKQQSQQSLQNSITTNGRNFVQQQNAGLTGTRSTQAMQALQPTQPTLPSIQTLPTIQTGYHWQEYKPDEYRMLERQSKLFMDKYDTKGNVGPISALINSYKDGESFLGDTALPRWALALCTLGFSELYVQTASFIDNFIWDINKDNKDSLIKNILVNPWIEVSNGNATWGQALLGTALNYLSARNQIQDIFANPIKGIANNGFQGFLDAFGIGGNGYVAFDWDTGNFALDLLAEILSDPMTFVTIANGAINGAAKGTQKLATNTGAAVGKQAAKNVSKELIQEGTEQATKELTEKLSTKFAAEFLSDITTQTGKKLTKATKEQIAKLAAKELAERGVKDLNSNVSKTLLKNITNNLNNLLDTGTNLTTRSLKKLTKETLTQVVSDTTSSTLKQIAKETKDKTIKKLYRVIANNNIIANKTAKTSRAYTQQLNELIAKKGMSTAKDLGRIINWGSINGKQVVNKVDDIFKLSSDIIEDANSNLFTKVVASAKKANIPINEYTIQQIQNGVTEFMRELDIDKMTAQIMSATGLIEKQAQRLHPSKIIGWFSQASKDLDSVQRTINKLADYTTIPGLPLLGKAIKHLPVVNKADQLRKRGEDLFTMFCSRQINRTASRFQNAVANTMQELTPESYIVLRNTFNWSSNVAVETFKEGVKLGKKSVIDSDKLALETAANAFQVQFINQFSQDVQVYNKLMRKYNKNLTAVTTEWEDYIQKTYNKNAASYLKVLEEINSIEQEATGNAVYQEIISSIKANNAAIETNVLNSLIEDSTEKAPFFIVKDNIEQGRALSQKELESLNEQKNIQIMNIEDFNKNSRALVNQQVYIQTNNKVIVEQELYDKYDKLLSDYANGTPENLLSEIEKCMMYYKSGDVYKQNASILKDKLEAAKLIKQELNLLRSNPALYSVVAGDEKAQKELYICLADAFMGLNSKIKGTTSITEVAFELARTAELELKTKQVFKKMPTGFLTNDADFLENLRATLEIYMNRLPDGKFLISELKDTLPVLNSLKTELIRDVGAEDKLVQKLQAFYDDVQLVSAKVSDQVIIIPSEVFRLNLDKTYEASIQEMLMKAAAGNFAGTLTTISDGTNLNKYFGNISLKRTFEASTVEAAQTIANNAEHIYNSIYFKIKNTPAVNRINAVWEDVLNTLDRSMDRNKYYRELFDILNSTRDLDIDRKYALLKTLYQLDISSSSAASEMHSIVKSIIEADNYRDVYTLIRNTEAITNKPVYTGVGLDVQRAKNMYLTDRNQRAVADLNHILTEQKQIQRSSVDLEERIRNVSNTDALLAQNLEQIKALNAFNNDIIEPYQKEIEAAINHKAMSSNIEIVKDSAALGFFDGEDIQTIRDIYAGLDVEPEKIVKLENRIEAYNRTVLDKNYFEYEYNILSNDFGEDYEKQYKTLIKKLEKNKKYVPTTKETALINRYESIEHDYKEFVTLMTKAHLSEKDLDILSTKYINKITAYSLIPNAIKSYFAKQYRLLTDMRIRIQDLGFINRGITSDAGRQIEINSRLLNKYKAFKYTFKHETVHSALTFNDFTTHKRTVDQFWNYLKKTPNKDFIDNLYLATWWNYKKSAGDSLGFYFNSDIFSWDNRQIKEEVMANIIAGQDDLEALLNKYHGYLQAIPKEYQRLIKPDANTMQYTEEIIQRNNDFFNGLVQAGIDASPNKIYDLPLLHEGKYLALNEPYKLVGEIMRDYRQANKNRMYNLIRKRLSQTPQQFAEDLARTGPFQFYSISNLKNARGRYTIHNYFDDDFNVRPNIQKELKKNGVHILRDESTDTIMFYIDKEHFKVHSNRPFTPVNINYEATKWKSIERAGQEYSLLTNIVSGQSLGYSHGFKIDENFWDTLFYGTKDGFESNYPTWKGLLNLSKKDIGGWTREDFVQPIYYSGYRFNEMIMGDIDYNRRFGIYLSSNPLVNMSNSLQQMHTMTKAKTNMLTLYFDDLFSTSGTGLWARYSDEELLKAFQDHPEMVFVTMRGKTKKGALPEFKSDNTIFGQAQTTNKFGQLMLGKDWNPVRVQEFLPTSVADIAKLRKAGARFVPKSWYNQMYNTINNRIGSGGLLKYINRINYIYKMLALGSNPMTFVRNAFDTYLKNDIELGDEMPHWTSYAWRLQSDYQDIVNILERLGISGDKAIKEFFDSGLYKAYTRNNLLDYQMYLDLKNYNAWGPSTKGLADLVKSDDAGMLTDDELMRIAARDTVVPYKGTWEKFVDINGKYFDFCNNTIGLKAEKTNRLALYLKAMSEGQTKEQAFEWIRKVHFDYSVRNLAEQSLETVMPFITFTMKNAAYWLDAIEKNPTVQRLLSDYLQVQWAYYDYDPDQMAASKQWQNQISSGNIPLYKNNDGIVSYFKLSPSFADAFNTIINPLGVIRDRLILPINAIEKTFTEDYKGQSLMGKQDTWHQTMDWLSKIPGNSVARRITNAIKQKDTLSAIGEVTGATGHANMKPYTPRNYGYKQKIKYVYNNNDTYYKRMYSTPFRVTRAISNAYKYQQISKQVAKWRRARNLDIGKRILDPYTAIGQRLTKSLYLRPNTVIKKHYSTSVPRATKRYYSLAQYRVQTALFR